MSNYTCMLRLEFQADDLEEMRERLWELEKILDTNNYNIRESHTCKVEDMRSVIYGR